MEYKVGDKVLCKRSVKSGIGEKIFKKGHYYKITEVNLPNENVPIEFDIYLEGHVDGEDKEFGFDMNEYFDEDKQYELFDYHFYTKEEERKLKLKKLC